ncbi:hypothetical protein [Butyricicoccus pullicaecorum]|uniref:hypothetical protein n=1 Tax=Butyricicoccus pullicaecorum TaxID=501571 RepID=UPI003990CD93
MFLGQCAALLGECGQTAFFVQIDWAGAAARTAVQTALGRLFGRSSRSVTMVPIKT